MMGVLRNVKYIDDFFKKHERMLYKIEEDAGEIKVHIYEDFWVKGMETMGEIPFPITIVGGGFLMDGKGLHTTKNFPIIVEGNFSVDDNFLYETDNLPECSKDMSLANNRLKNFIGFQKKINGDLNVSGNCINSFEGFPELIRGNVYLQNNWELINNKSIGIILNSRIEKVLYLNNGQLKDYDLDLLKRRFKVILVDGNTVFHKEIDDINDIEHMR